MFESSVGRATEELTQLFYQFEKASTTSNEWLRPKRRHQLLKHRNSIKENFDPLLDIRAETSLLTEVRDIRDELNILSMVLNAQLFTLGDFRSSLIDEISCTTTMGAERYYGISLGVGGGGGGGGGGGCGGGRNTNKVVSSFVTDIRKRTLDQERRLKVHKRDIDAMDEQAERLYKSLTDLLDLKQKHSNALEARFASEQALAAAKEGQTVMVFTIVTIIFMPMSFIAAYFGINIDSFGDSLPHSYVATWTFGGGMAISTVFILMAFMVVDIAKAAKGVSSFTKRHFNTGTQVGKDVTEMQPLYRTVTPVMARERSNETIVYRGEMDDGTSPGGKMYREYSKTSGASGMSRTLSNISTRQRAMEDDIEKGGYAKGGGAHLRP